MAETTDQESKTEEPTEKKVRDALEQGKIPVSREASIFASMAALMVIQMFLIGQGVQQLTPMLTSFLDDPDGFPLSTGADALNLLTVVGLQAFRFLVPLVATLSVFGLAASLLQNAPSLVLQRIAPDLSRISPLSGWSRLFGAQGLVEFAKSLFKLVSVTVVVVVVLRSSEAKAFEAMYTDPVALPEMILNIAMRIVSAICIATIVLVAIDLAWARFHWRRELRMTRQEIKDEHKQAEGDPLIKARLRSLARDRSRQRMIASTSRATLVIAKPDALRDRIALQARGKPGADRRGQGHGRDRAKDPRNRRAESYSGDREQGAGAGALRGGSGRPGDSGGVLPTGRRDHLLPAIQAGAAD
ncbi:flagellar biosynthetic protein FlhB [Bradyrhizobium sp. LM3.6]